MSLKRVTIQKPEAVYFVLGHVRAARVAQDLGKVLMAVPDLRFGFAFCEGAGECPSQLFGTDEALEKVARRNAKRVLVGLSFLLFLDAEVNLSGALSILKSVPGVSRILCATPNASDVIVVKTAQGKGILGVVDSVYPQAVQRPKRAKRKALQPGYKA